MYMITSDRVLANKLSMLGFKFMTEFINSKEHYVFVKTKQLEKIIYEQFNDGQWITDDRLCFG